MAHRSGEYRRAENPRQPRSRRLTTLRSAPELFGYALNHLYTAELLLLGLFEDMSAESTDSDLAAAFKTHGDETDRHLDRLTDVAASLNIQIRPVRSPAVDGIISERKLFSKAGPVEEVVDLFLAAAGQTAERYEISAYESLIELGGKLGHTSAILTLQETLVEEKAALKHLKTISDRLPTGSPTSRGPAAEPVPGTRSGPSVPA